MLSNAINETAIFASKAIKSSNRVVNRVRSHRFVKTENKSMFVAGVISKTVCVLILRTPFSTNNRTQGIQPEKYIFTDAKSNLIRKLNGTHRTQSNLIELIEPIRTFDLVRLAQFFCEGSIVFDYRTQSNPIA